MLVQRTPPAEVLDQTRIPLSHGFYALVDPKDYIWLSRWRWKAKRSNYGWYAVRVWRFRGREYLIRMHREITGCPQGLETHHINHRTLDNRRSNLENLTPAEHRLKHRFG